MKERAVQKTNSRRSADRQNPRLAVVNRLRSMANLFRTQAKITEEADEALHWEKLADEREKQITAGQIAA